MANKNTKLGGTDWANNEVVSNTDLNDTFDAAWNKIRTLSCFWLNSDLFEVYDDFESYSTGAFTSGDSSNWTVTDGTGGATTIETSANAGASTGTQEVKIYMAGRTGTNSSLLTSTNLIANRHTFARVHSTVSSDSVSTTQTIAVQFGNDGTYLTIFTKGSTQAATSLNSIHIINTADGAYDLYIGGKLMRQYAGISAANAQIIFKSQGANGDASHTSVSTLYVDDVRQSAHTAI